jgi:hypothetical protein
LRRSKQQQTLVGLLRVCKTFVSALTFSQQVVIASIRNNKVCFDFDFEDWKVLTLEDRLILASRVVIESIKNNNRPSRSPDDNVETNQKVAQTDPADLRRSSGPFASYERNPE